MEGVINKIQIIDTPQHTHEIYTYLGTSISWTRYTTTYTPWTYTNNVLAVSDHVLVMGLAAACQFGATPWPDPAFPHPVYRWSNGRHDPTWHMPI